MKLGREMGKLILPKSSPRENAQKGNKQTWGTEALSQVKKGMGRTSQVEETAQIKEKRNVKMEYVQDWFKKPKPPGKWLWGVAGDVHGLGLNV